MALLEVEGLGKVYNTKLGARACTALRDVSFEVTEGEFVAIMGPSGSGKTTLLNILASLDKPTTGDVRLDGRSFSSIKPRELCAFRRDRMGFVFQDFNLLDTFSLKDNMLLPLVLMQTPIPEMEARVSPLAEQLGILPLMDKYPFEVSGGEKQRAAIGRAVITNPRILLADEPTGALDSKSSKSLLELFSSFHAAGRTILMVTHSAMAASYASRVLFISDGALFSQLYRGDEDNRAFFERIVVNISALGGGDIA